MCTTNGSRTNERDNDNQEGQMKLGWHRRSRRRLLCRRYVATSLLIMLYVTVFHGEEHYHQRQSGTIKCGDPGCDFMLPTANAWSTTIHHRHVRHAENRGVKHSFSPSMPSRTIVSFPHRATSNDGDQEENKSDDENHEDRPMMSSADLDDEVDEYQAQQDAADKVMDRIMLPRRIGSAISSTVTAFAYAFLIATFVLNMFGYSLASNGSIEIVTLEERAFRDEVVKVQRQQRLENEQEQRRQQQQLQQKKTQQSRDQKKQDQDDASSTNTIN